VSRSPARQRCARFIRSGRYQRLDGIFWRDRGAGGLGVAGGAQTLSGVNTYTGVTQIDAGATLA